MRNFLLVTAVMALTLVAALPAEVSAQPGCNPYTQGAWAARAPMPVPVVRAWGQYFTANGNFYVLGGRQSDAAGNELLNPREYNPITNTWVTKAATFPTNLVNNVVGGIVNMGGADVIVIVGGSVVGGTATTAETRTYNPLTDTLTVIATDPWPGSPPGGNLLPGGSAVVNNRLYVFGGFNNPVAVDNRIWEFNPAAAAGSRWTLKAATLPAPRGYIPTAASGNFIYLFGGSDWDGAALLDTNQSLRYDPATDTISTVATIPRAVAETRALTNPFDGSIWVISGGRTPPNPTTDVNVYLPATNTWITTFPIPTARRNFPAGIDNQFGRIWATGGYDLTGAPSVVNEQFTCGVPVDLMTFGIE